MRKIFFILIVSAFLAACDEASVKREMTCGNGSADPGERCDDGNTSGGDGCSSACAIEDGYECPTFGAACRKLAESPCGNGKSDPGETCDDGNTSNGDGCSDKCKHEPKYRCTFGEACIAVETPEHCGNGKQDGSEACDDGNETGGDGCSADCKVEEKFECLAFGKACSRLCHHKVCGPCIDIEDFGADPTGAEDSSEALRSALKAAHETKRSVYFRGTFQINEPVFVNEEVKDVKGLCGDVTKPMTIKKFDISDFAENQSKGIAIAPAMYEGIDFPETKIPVEPAEVGATIWFDRKQKGKFNSNNDPRLDYREDACLIIEGVSDKIIHGIKFEYRHTENNNTVLNRGEMKDNESFYTRGDSYFGTVNNIYVTDASSVLIDHVESTGANMNGVLFFSKKAAARGGDGDKLFKREIKEEEAHVLTNNRIRNSYLHDNRQAGSFVAYQKGFVAENNILEANGHPKDGGTGYGISILAGTYNFDTVFRNNLARFNYRKGLDAHEGNGVTIEDNVSYGDRLYGIEVYNRRYPLLDVKINNNIVIQNPSFRIIDDDGDLNKETVYHLYLGISVDNNSEKRDFKDNRQGIFEIKNNIILNLDILHTEAAKKSRAILFRSANRDVDYTINIADNKIRGKNIMYCVFFATDSFIREFERNYAVKASEGPGTGNLRAINNECVVEKLVQSAFYVVESQKVTLYKIAMVEGNLKATRFDKEFLPAGTRNSIEIKKNVVKSDQIPGSQAGIYIGSNPRTMIVTDNKFDYSGEIDKIQKHIFAFNGKGYDYKQKKMIPSDLIFENNTVHSKRFADKIWGTVENIKVVSDKNNIRGTEEAHLRIE